MVKAEVSLITKTERTGSMITLVEAAGCSPSLNPGYSLLGKEWRKSDSSLGEDSGWTR